MTTNLLLIPSYILTETAIFHRYHNSKQYKKMSDIVVLLFFFKPVAEFNNFEFWDEPEETEENIKRRK